MSFVRGSLLGQPGIPAGGTETERDVQALLESGSGPLVAFGDQRLNSLAAQTFNESTCVKMYELIEKSLLPQGLSPSLNLYSRHAKGKQGTHLLSACCNRSCFGSGIYLTEDAATIDYCTAC